MQNTLRGFRVDHICSTPVSMVYKHHTRHSKNKNFVLEKPETGLDLNSFKLGLSCGLVLQKFFKT